MAIIGAILGDISGSRYEFVRPANLNWKQCELFTDDCYCTDDTVMTLATKFAIRNSVSFADAYRKFGKQYPNAGYGCTFESWIDNPIALPYGSYGNGSAMRCSYIGEYFDNEKDVVTYAIKSAECTHNHPEGIKGAVVTAMCIYMAKRGATKSDIFNYVKRHYPKEKYKYSIEHTLEKYRETYKWDITCQGSVPVAIECFLESEDYESFLRNVYSLSCDMDTICAIGGGVAEEFYKGTGFNNASLLSRYLDNYLLRCCYV